MSQRFRPSGKEVLKALNRLGFETVRIRGSHHRLRHPDGRVTTVPIHAGDTVGPGLLSKILRDAQVSKDELRAAL